jgi:mono/diheme cytochrome c family protein
MNRNQLAGVVVFFALSGVCFAEDAATTFQARVLPVLQSHCVRCHGADKPKAKINLAGERTLEQLAGDRDLWFRVLDQIDFKLMPPEDAKKLSEPERQALADWVRGEFTALQADRQLKEGRSKLRRLNRGEYANTILDLFGVLPDVGAHLPEDGRVDGYDKVSAAVPLSAEGAMGYVTMAEELLNKFVLQPIPQKNDLASRTLRVAAAQTNDGNLLKLEDGTYVSFNSDSTSGRLNMMPLKTYGWHRVRMSVYGYQTDKPMPFGIYVGNTWAYPEPLVLSKILYAPPDKPAVLETELYLEGGEGPQHVQYVGMRLIPLGLGLQVPIQRQDLAKKCQGPGLAVQWVEIEAPERPFAAERFLTGDFPNELVEQLRKNQPPSLDRDELLRVMRATFQRVGARLYRRDLTEAEINEIVADISKRLDAGASLRTVFFEKVTELLTAPDFLCVIEPPGRLSDFALASRLSYFLWNSTPDEPLLNAARQGKLRDPTVLREQAERLLKDPKSNRFVAEFLKQWLNLRAIDDTSPEPNLYPEYAEKGNWLKLSSVMETEAFFRRVLDENLSVRQFVDSRWLLVNEELAKFYGLPDVRGPELRKVDLPESSPYGGIWTQSAVMKVTANGTNTSPVKRGVWVAERLLGTPIPPPPPNVQPVEPDARNAKTLREQLALHRGSGSCAACHKKFDPFGFALESFDVTGRFRTHYREADAAVIKLPPWERKGRSTWRDGSPVEAAGETPEGQAFAGIVELRKLLAENPEQLARGVTRHLITYSTGASVNRFEERAIDRIVKTAGPDYGLRSLIHAVVQSELFGSK